jgi:lipopolysaccharide transport system ATP-binding protein
MKPAIKIENLSKQYRLGTVGTGTFSNDINRWWQTTIRGKEDPYLAIGETNNRETKGSSDYVWALKDINFEVQPGEILGIIGKNGAGKSTLLKLLSRVTAPTTGRITSYGRIASLLEVGTGFHPELTGRENVFLNGAIMGMTKKEIRAKLDEIVDFSGCERYIDTPVKRYSSGMYVRLAFAVAAHLEPEILIVDEVLAVGDAEFQKKAIGKMQEVSQGQGRTVLFVSHNMASIENLCSKVYVMEQGTGVFLGETMEGINRYLRRRISNTETDLGDRQDRIGDGRLRFESVELINNGVKGVNLNTGCKAEFVINYNVSVLLTDVVFRFQIVDSKDNLRFVCNNVFSTGLVKRIKDNGFITLEVDNFPLPDGKYYYHLKASSQKVLLDEVEFAGVLDVDIGDFFGSGKVPGLKGGVFVNHKWR